MTKGELEKIRDDSAEKMATNRLGDYDDLELPQEAAYFLQEVECFKSGFDCASQLLMKEIESLQAKLKVAEDALEDVANSYSCTACSCQCHINASKTLAELRKTE